MQGRNLAKSATSHQAGLVEFEPLHRAKSDECQVEQNSQHGVKPQRCGKKGGEQAALVSWGTASRTAAVCTPYL